MEPDKKDVTSCGCDFAQGLASIWGITGWGWRLLPFNIWVESEMKGWLAGFAQVTVMICNPQHSGTFRVTLLLHGMGQGIKRALDSVTASRSHILTRQFIQFWAQFHHHPTPRYMLCLPLPTVACSKYFVSLLWLLWWLMGLPSSPYPPPQQITC